MAVNMLTSVDDLFEIDDKIKEINKQRQELASQLQKNKQSIDEIESSVGKKELIADEIFQWAIDLNGVKSLKQKYGNLKILQQLESAYLQQDLQQNAKSQLEKLNIEVERLLNTDSGEASIETLSDLSLALLKVKETLKCPSNEVFSKFDEFLILRANSLSNDFNQTLLESKWDTPAFAPISGHSIERMREMSTTLYKLGTLSVNSDDDNWNWNFKCIANNFNIRFTYHFHNDTFKLETYFNFLNDYLTENLHKCISIFHDEANGLSKQVVLEQFINHVLMPIRDKTRSNLLKNDKAILIALISQILTTDRNLSKKFHYHGDGLISLISPDLWDIWLSHEVATATKQFEKITEDPKEMVKSASDFVRLLNKMYQYLLPFYECQAESLRRYKLLTCSQIFINLSSSYLDFFLAVDSLDEHRTEEDELYQTLVKLQNFNIVYKRIFELSQEYIFIGLTDIVNEKEGKDYHSLFQNVLNEYTKIIEEIIQPSVVHRSKRLLKESLRNYFKIASWSTSTSQVSTPSAEIVNAIKLMKRVIQKLELLDIPLEVSLGIKNELLNIIVNYFIESILKLNRFNHSGLKQFEFDFQALRDSLNLPNNFLNFQESILMELLKVLFMKYDTTAQEYFEKSYIKRIEFASLKKYLSIKSLKDSEIQDALYRVAYGNVI